MNTDPADGPSAFLAIPDGERELTRDDCHVLGGGRQFAGTLLPGAAERFLMFFWTGSWYASALTPGVTLARKGSAAGPAPALRALETGRYELRIDGVPYDLIVR